MTAIALSGSGVTIADVARVTRGGASFEASPAVLERLARARAVLDRAAAAGQPIYGLNTGLGANHSTAVADPALFQIQLVRGRTMAVGPAFSRTQTRAAMAARAAMLATGGSGISPAVFEALLALLRAGVHPVLPSIGSIGASDLVLLAPLALAIAGEGEAEHGGHVLPAADALRSARLAPVPLGPKDGLSLMSAPAVAVGLGALLCADARALLQAARESTALAFEAMAGNPTVLLPQVQAARPAVGQVAEAAALLALLDGSSLHEGGHALQDPLSLRCVASIHGTLAHALDGATTSVETELNAASDNPLVLVDEDRVLSTGNFHTPALALAFETLGLAIAQAALATAGRFVQMTGAARGGLPRYLSPVGGASAGFVPLQKTVAALVARIRRNAAPVMLDILAVSEGVEDHATQAPLAAAKCGAILDDWRYLVACEMLAGAQALDLHAGHRPGIGGRRCHAAVRALCAPLRDDRPLGPDVERLAAHLRPGDGSPS